jgi:hypothetical protein
VKEPLENLFENLVEGKPKIDPGLEASFWKEKCFSVVPVLLENIVDLELENQLLRTENKSLVEYKRRKDLFSKCDKKENSITINSLGVNIFVNSEFKSSTS